ncbi:MAG: ATP-binding protein, partial [Ignavibacteriae bacterium]|nr:ATP-binding protein [Ignavibacteriota bacterium]
MVARAISDRLLSLSKKIPVLIITGPRQSGKTTLAKSVFPDYRYISLENPDNLDFALSDPKGFLNTYGRKLIIDEVQYAPKLFSYIQTITDDKKENGMYILTGSQNFLLHAKISQSLAGRVIIFNLLPFSYDELRNTKYRTERLSELIVKGFYPRIYDSGLNSFEWYPSYIQTYLERDVRQILNVGDINAFRNFLRVCAGRCGQVLNLSSIGSDLGISYQTVKKWLSVLQQSYIVYLLQPYYENFNKRIIKSPKLYFYDTGLVCSLLGINSPESYELHYLKGGIFESYVISELLKNKFNTGSNSELFYWKDLNGNEIDCIITNGSEIKAIEIKAGETVKSDFFKTLYLWNKLNVKRNSNINLIYGGTEKQKRESVKVFGWK